MDRSSNSNSYSHSRHHYDSYESSSIVSMPTDTESESDSSEKNTSIAKAPVMVSRSYLFEGAPIYISDFFVANHLIDSSSHVQSARNLRQFACISQAHRQYIYQLLSRDGMREIAFCSTRRAVPLLLKELNSNKKSRIKGCEIARFVRATPRLYVDSAFDKFFNFKKNTVLRKICLHPDIAELRIDGSGPNYENFLKIQNGCPIRRNDLHKFYKADAAINTLKEVCEKSRSRPLKIDFVFKNWYPNESKIENFFHIQLSMARHKKQISFGAVLLGRDVRLSKSWFGFQNKYRNSLVENQFSALQILCRAVISHNATQLFLNGLCLEDESAANLIKLISKHDKNSLEILDMSSNSIQESTVERLVDFLKLNNSLQILLLSNNFIGDEDAKKLCKVLALNKNLKKINLSCNLISYDHRIWKDSRVTGRPVKSVLEND